MVGSVTPQDYHRFFFETQITVKEVVLYESILHPEGAEYHILEVFDLRKV